MANFPVSDELVKFPVQVTCNVCQDCMPVGSFVQAIWGHHRKQMLDPPTVSCRLKQGKITK